jgi:hypothetical protein
VATLDILIVHHLLRARALVNQALYQLARMPLARTSIHATGKNRTFSIISDFASRVCLSRAGLGKCSCFRLLNQESGCKKEPFFPFFNILLSCFDSHRVDAVIPAENGFFEPFIYKNEHFAKTGSGLT